MVNEKSPVRTRCVNAKTVEKEGDDDDDDDRETRTRSPMDRLCRVTKEPVSRRTSEEPGKHTGGLGVRVGKTEMRGWLVEEGTSDGGAEGGMTTTETKGSDDSEGRADVENKGGGGSIACELIVGNGSSLCAIELRLGSEVKVGTEVGIGIEVKAPPFPGHPLGSVLVEEGSPGCDNWTVLSVAPLVGVHVQQGSPSSSPLVSPSPSESVLHSASFHSRPRRAKSRPNWLRGAPGTQSSWPR